MARLCALLIDLVGLRRLQPNEPLVKALIQQ